MATVAGEIGFDRLVDRRLVHRRANAEVLLTGLARAGPHAWSAAVQIPRGHVRVGPGGQVAEVLGLEVARQVGIALAHTAYDVPADWAFTLQEAWLAWVQGPAMVPPGRPLDLWVDVRVEDEVLRRGTIAGLGLELTLRAEGEVLARTGGELRVIAPRHYRALRRNAPDGGRAPVRRDPVPVLGAGVDSGHIGYDLGDPFFFDHATDYLPGMLLAHAMTFLFRRAHPGVEVGRLTLSCTRFVEHVPLATIRRVADGTGDRFAFEQDGTEVATGRVEPTGVHHDG